MFKTRVRLIFNFFFNINHCCRTSFILQKSVFKALQKQMKYEYEKCFFSIVLLILYYHKCTFKTNGKLLFSLWNFFCNMKNVCSKQAGGCFLVYSATFVIWKKGGYFLVYSAYFLIRKIFVQNKWRLLFSLLSYFYNMKNVHLKK